MQPAILSLPFLKKEAVGQDIYSFYFDTAGKNFSFLPGQYMRVKVPGVSLDPRGDSRLLSISSSTSEKNIIMHTTRITDSPYKKALGNLRKGDKVDFFGPVGRFIVDEGFKGMHVLLSGGMGITPFRSILKSMYSYNSKLKFLLIAAFSKYEDVIFLEDFTDISKNSKNLHVVYTLSGDKNFKKWTGEKGKIDSVLLSRHISDFGDSRFYICGPEGFVLTSEEMLVALGVSEENINLERFRGY